MKFTLVGVALLLSTMAFSQSGRQRNQKTPDGNRPWTEADSNAVRKANGSNLPGAEESSKHGSTNLPGAEESSKEFKNETSLPGAQEKSRKHGH
ncbi:MAG TPA: hypothetical protein VNJ08_13175 [Bacteriovoracaceae bacterium]|nr:hypothetical protein [Bacteriovoracaceae bacterium]